MKNWKLKSLLAFAILAFLPTGQSVAKESIFQKVVKFDRNDHNHPNHHHDSSCRGPATSPIPPGSCSANFDKKLHAAQIKNSNLIYFDIKDLDFLQNSSAAVLKEAELEVTFKGKLTESQTVTLSLNGFKVSRPGGLKKFFTLLDYLKSRDESHGRFKLEQLSLHGSESLDRFLARLKKNKGVLRIALHGKHPRVLDAYLTLRGTSYFPCTNPSPTTTTTITLPGSTTTTTTLQQSPSTTTTTLPQSPSTTTTTLPAPTTTTSTTTTTTTTTLPPEDLSLYKVQIDSVEPAKSPTASTSLLVYFSSTNTDGSYLCALDQTSFEKCQSPVSLTGLSNGSHQFQVYAQTPRGASTVPASYTWNVDSVPPVVQITNLESLPSLTNQTAITFQFSSNKTGTFKCSLDGSQAVACTSPMNYSVVTEGLHTFAVSAIDSVGNVSGSAAQYQWTIDLTAPTAFISSVSPAEELTAQKSKSFVFAASETSNFECSLDNVDFAACQSPVSFTELSEGNHLFQLRATDLAGNVSAVISSAWTTDYTAPVLTLGTVSPAQGLTNANSASVEFFSNEAGKIYCQWDAENVSECSSPLKKPMADGSHQLTVYAVDSVGLESERTTLAWNADSTAPVISFAEILPSNASHLNATQLSFAINASENASLSATLNGVALNPVSNPIILSDLAEGSYTLEVSGFDAAGNFSNTISHSFEVDLTAPIINLDAGGAALTNLDSRSLTFSSNEDAVFLCALDEAGFEPCQSPRTYSGLADGDHKMIVMATDLAGNSAQTSATWTVDTTAPSTLESHNQIRTAITFSLGSNESNVNYLCSLDGQEFAACSSPVSYTGLAVGSHRFIAKAVDTAGNTDPVGAIYDFTVQAPIQTRITSTNPAGSTVTSKSMTISFTADQTASGYQCSLDGAALSACSSPVSYSGLAEGAHTFLVKAIDAYGVMDTNGATLNWSIDSVVPTVTGFTTTSTTNTITVTWFTSEPATAKVIYGVGTAQNQSTAETTVYATSQSVKLTGLSSNTSYSIKVTGRDAAGNVYTSTIFTARTNR